MPTEKLIRRNGSFVLYYGNSADATAGTVVSAVFTATPNNLVVSFNASASINASSYFWDFGDGTTFTTTSATTSHTYASAGTRTVTLTASATDGSSDTSTQSITVSAGSVSSPPTYTLDDGNGGTTSSPGSGLQPTGAGYTALSTGGSDIGAQANALTGTTMLSLPVGTQQKLPGWSSSVTYAALITSGGGGIIGAGSAKSIISQVPNTSDGGTGFGKGIIRINKSNYTLQDFQLLGTTQSYMQHQGIFINGNNVSLNRVKLVNAGPGNDKAPPGETFGVSYYNVGQVGTIDDVEIDGAGFGASNFGTNGSGGINNTAGNIGDYTVNRLYSHHNYYSGCIALWQQNGIATFNDMTVDMARCFWNIERCAGKVIINRPRIGTLHAAPSGTWDTNVYGNPNGSIRNTPGAVGIFCEADSYVGSTLANAFRFEVHDPRNLDGSPYTGPRITVNFGGANDGGTQYYGRNQFKAYNAAGTDISSSFYTYGGAPAN